MTADTPQPAAYLQVQTTLDGETAARALARRAVEARAAACAQVVGPVTSTYWWQGEVETTTEWLVLLKTTGEAYGRLAELVEREHPHDTPELIAVPVTAGAAGYLGWVAEETRAR